MKNGRKHLYTCFVDLQKAFDTVPRSKLFYKLLRDYSIGGKFLQILQEMYKDNQIYVKLPEGLAKPFTTTISVKQGCVFSPLLFNLYIDKICKIFDSSCDPVSINNTNLNCLLWADDLLLVSESATGLQKCLDKMQIFYSELGLKVNLKKTKVMIFNNKGAKLDNYKFYLNGDRVSITDQYQYLGIKLRPSGSLQMAVDELHDKALRAWFSISNIVFKNKRMEPYKVFGLFDSLVTPVALYGCEFWLPHIIKKSGLSSPDRLLDSWESFKPETINQKCSRMILGVHRKASRLAVLGELGRYPLFITAMSQLLKYRISLDERPFSLVGQALTEMSSMTSKGQDCWLNRVDTIMNLLKINHSDHTLSKVASRKFSSSLKSKFDIFWKKKVNEIKHVNNDHLNHNKLEFIAPLKVVSSRNHILNLSVTEIKGQHSPDLGLVLIHWPLKLVVELGQKFHTTSGFAPSAILKISRCQTKPARPTLGLLIVKLTF